MRHEEKTENELREKVEKLEKTVDALLYEIEASNRESTIEPDTENARKHMRPKKRPIIPPWERAGYETKDEWVENR